MKIIDYSSTDQAECVPLFAQQIVGSLCSREVYAIAVDRYLRLDEAGLMLRENVAMF